VLFSLSNTGIILIFVNFSQCNGRLFAERRKFLVSKLNMMPHMKVEPQDLAKNSTCGVSELSLRLVGHMLICTHHYPPATPLHHTHTHSHIRTTQWQAYAHIYKAFM